VKITVIPVKIGIQPVNLPHLIMGRQQTYPPLLGEDQGGVFLEHLFLMSPAGGGAGGGMKDENSQYVILLTSLYNKVRNFEEILCRDNRRRYESGDLKMVGALAARVCLQCDFYLVLKFRQIK
jgi:hypothetical protein